MKKIQFWSLLLGFVFGSLAFTGCSSSDSDSPVVNPTPTPDTPTDFPGDPANMKFASFSGVVKNGNLGLPNVTVKTGTQTVQTDQNGFYKFDQVNVHNGRVIIDFEKAGYMSVTRSIPEGQNTRLDVNMMAIAAEQVLDSESDGSIQINTGSGTMIVYLGSGYKTENGAAYTGSVTAKAVYLNPDDEKFADQMPGDLSAKRTDGSEAQLISYGMVGVELTGSNGQKLELSNDNDALLTFPIPDKFKSLDVLPATIPLWYFDEAQGLWIEEGTARLTDGNTAYRGTVQHFSWHNLDSPEAKATLKITVKDSNGKVLKYVPVDIDGQRTFYTDEKGQVKCDVASNWDFYVRIPSETCGNYTNYDPSKEVKINVGKLSGGEEKDLTLTLPVAAPIISGAVLNQGGGSNICSVYIYYRGDQTSPVMSDLNGAFQIFAPTYEGPAMLVVQFGNGDMFTKDFEMTGKDQTVNLVAKSSSGSGKSGSFSVVDSDGRNVKYDLPAGPNGGYWPASVTDGTLAIIGNTQPEGEWDWENIDKIEMFDAFVENYDPAKTDYDAITFSYFQEGGPHLRLYVTGPGKVVKNGSIYTIKMTNVVADQYEDQMRGMWSWSETPQAYKVTLEFSGKE